MIYADYYLDFPDEATATAVLYDGEDPRFQHIDTLGVLFDETVTPPAPLAGWHVNVRVIVGKENPLPLVPYAITLQNPRRVWAGPAYPVVLPNPKK